MTTQTILYKLDCNNRVREWCCWTEENKLIIRFGLLNGEKIFETHDYPNPEQANVHAERRIRKQCERRGYVSNIPTSRPLKPMLAHRYQDHADKLPELVFFQPKLNGFRCLGSIGQMRTRTNLLLPAFPHIQYVLDMLPEDLILDGELYLHNTRFQTIMKSRSNVPSGETFTIEYHVYDCVEPSLTYTQRRVLIADTMITLLDQYQKSPFIITQNGQTITIPFPLQVVQTNTGKLDETIRYLDKYTSERYEGVMIRNPQGTYEVDQRSYTLQKLKTRETDYYKIVDILPSPRRTKEGMLLCQLPNGTTFKCTLKEDRIQREYALRNPLNYVGKYAEVEYAEISLDGKPIQAVGRLMR